jgi:hypothetical protein
MLLIDRSDARLSKIDTYNSAPLDRPGRARWGAWLAPDGQVVSVYASVAFDDSLAITDIRVSESAKLP